MLETDEEITDSYENDLAMEYITDAQDNIYAHSLEAKEVEKNLKLAIDLLQEEAGCVGIYDEIVYRLVIAIHFARLSKDN